jgi:hypothetical protein
MKKMFLFFNHPAELPPGGDLWNNWKDPDTTKLAWVAAETWRRNGWQVERLDCSKVKGFLPFTGRLKEHSKIYPLEFWNVWFKAFEISSSLQEPILISTIDVLNFGLTPQALEMLMPLRPRFPLTFQSQHFSASSVIVDAKACTRIMDAICAYDAGYGPPIPTDLVSDETIIRHCLEYSTVPVQRYVVEPEAANAWLVHVPKSCLTRLFDGSTFNSVPLCCPTK